MDVLDGPGTVVVITGPSSAGKTTAAEVLRRALARPTIFLNGDDLDLPADSEAVRTLRALPPEQVPAMEAHFHRAYFGALASFAANGLHAIGEVLFKDPQTFAAFREATSGLPTLVVHLRCDREERTIRERARGDRAAGTTDVTSGQEWVPPPAEVDLVLDTTALAPQDAAVRIRERLLRGARPSAASYWTAVASSLFGEEARPVGVEPLDGGNFCESSKVRVVGGDAFVGRRFPPGPVGRVDRLVALLPRLADHGVPVPQPVWHRDDGEDAAVLLRWVDGHPCAEAPPALAEAAALARTVATIHGLDLATLDGVGLPTFPSHPSPAYQRRIAATALGRRAVELLERWTPSDDPSQVLVHGDLWSGNVLWRRGAIAAVIDWDRAGLGSPAADVASVRVDLLLRHGNEARDRFTEAYEAIAGPVAELPHWELRALASCSVDGGAAAIAGYRGQGLRVPSPDVVRQRLASALEHAVDAIGSGR